MAELAFPLEGHVYSAREAGLWFATRTSGVHASDSLAVTNGGGMSVSVGSGVAWLKYAEFTGAAYANTAAKIMAIEAADNTLPRIDRVVVRYSNTYNNIALAVVKGTPASAPVPPDITRDSLTYEISLARVRVNAGVTAITAYDITDERTDNTVCGLMTDGVTPFDPEMGGIIVDDTLTTEGAAADAKAVGDKFAETNQTINKKALEILQSRAPAVHAENHRCTDTITWDGNTEGYATVEWGVPEDGITLARVWQGEIPTELLNRDVVVNNHDPDGLLIPDEDMWYEHTKYRFEAVGDGAYIIKGTFYGANIGELEEDDFGFIYAGWYATKPNTTVHIFDAEYITLPEAGIYLPKTSFNGSICYTKSLTIPNHDFGNSTDPLTPEMISAAPKYHASETDAYGVADARLYGHVKNTGLESAIYQGDESKGQDSSKWYNGDGEVVANDIREAYELLLGKSISASCFWVPFYTILSMELSDFDAEISELYDYCYELDDRLSALGG